MMLDSPNDICWSSKVYMMIINYQQILNWKLKRYILCEHTYVAMCVCFNKLQCMYFKQVIFCYGTVCTIHAYVTYNISLHSPVTDILLLHLWSATWVLLWGYLYVYVIQYKHTVHNYLYLHVSTFLCNNNNCKIIWDALE